MMAFGREPLLSHFISYRLSATNCGGVSKMSTFNGLTVVNDKIKSELVQCIYNKIAVERIEKKIILEFNIMNRFQMKCSS